MNFYKRHLGDYAKDAGHLSMLEHGAYTLLLDRYYTTERAIANVTEAYRVCRARSAAEREAVDAVLAEFFVTDGEGFINRRAEEEIAKATHQREVNREVGKRGGRPKQTDSETDSVIGSGTDSVPVRNPSQTPDSTRVSEEADASSSSAARTGRPTIPCPYAEIVGLYHQILPTLPQVRVLDGKTGEARKKAMRGMWGWVLSSTKPDGTRRAETADQAIEWFRAYFTRATENDFVMGRTSRGAGHENWRADLDYLLSPKGLTQVIEKTAA